MTKKVGRISFSEVAYNGKCKCRLKPTYDNEIK